MIIQIIFPIRWLIILDIEKFCKFYIFLTLHRNCCCVGCRLFHTQVVSHPHWCGRFTPNIFFRSDFLLFKYHHNY